MNCLEYRRQVAAEPRSESAELVAHARTCAACAEFTAQMRQFDERIEAALRIPVPLWSSIGSLTERWPRAPLALAASLMLAVTVAAILWMLVPRTSLADAIVAHMKHEPHAMQVGTTVSADALSHAMGGHAMPAPASLGRVTYAQSCWIRGHFVPHLVIDEGGEPVTVLLLAHETVKEPTQFSEDGYTGVIVPTREGVIVVLTWNESHLAAIAQRIGAAMAPEGATE